MHLALKLSETGADPWESWWNEMTEELRQRFVRARLAAILQHELREEGYLDASSHVAIVPSMGYLVAIGRGDYLTIRLVEGQ